MATRKSGTKKASTRKSQVTTSRSDTVEARPIGEGKDPLAEGERLYNPTNTEAETHYDADRSELDDEEKASKIRGLDANERAEIHNAETAIPSDEVPNGDDAEQEEVAQSRVEPVDANVDDTPENVDVPEVSEEDQAKASEEREAAMAKELELEN